MTRNFVQLAYRRVIVFLLGISLPLIALANDTITMNMRDADIRTVIQWMAETTGKNFVVDPTVQGTITVLSSEPLAPDQAFNVFLQALAINGFSASVKSNMVSIVPAAKASNNHSAVLDSFGGRAGAEKAVHVFSTTNVDATLVAAQLQALVGEHGSLSALPNTNTLLIADSIDNIKRIRQLVNRLDQRGQIDVDVVQLKYLDSSDALRTLQALANTDENADKPALAADARSNSLLLSGTPSQRLRLRELINKLDKKQSERGTTEVVFVQYMDAAELVPILQSVTASSQDASSDREQASIEASETANALILTASEPVLRDMKKVIAEIDIERQQVLLEAIIVEVNDDLVEQLGVQWNTSFTGDGVEAATNFSLGGLPSESGALDSSVLGEGFTLGYYRNGSLRALLNALDNSSDANLLSTPSVVALDNEQAEILVGSNVPIISGRQTSAASDTDDPFTTIERHDIGVSLQITPQINQHGGILLDVLQKVESISNSAIAEDLIFDKRSIKTKVNIEDNEVLVLGGLTRQDTVQSVDRVPVLGYIPILGRIFQNRTDQTVRSNLMVFIHPRILGKKDTRSKISKERYDTIKEQATTKKQAQESPLLENFNLNQ
ncbi:MAG: type II secretion system secretin GspD [Pseudomonadales bacterium]